MSASNSGGADPGAYEARTAVIGRRRGSMRSRSLRGVVMALGVAALAVLSGTAVARQASLGAFVAGIALAATFPEAFITVAIGWIAICRPGAELVKAHVGGNTVTEVDVMVVFALISSLSWVLRERPCFPWPRRALLTLLWPTILGVRALLPALGLNTLHGSTLVDLRLVEAYVLLVPVVVLERRRGPRRLVEILMVIGIVASLVAVAALVGVRLGLLAPHEWSIVNVSASAAGDIRPGGELVVCIAAVLVILGTGFQSRRGRIVAAAAIMAELVLSKTLSLVLAIGVGSTSALMFGWRQVKPAVRRTMVAVTIVVVGLGLGVLDPGGRYDLGARVDQTSGQYRESELKLVSETLAAGPMIATVGAGVGTMFSFGGPYVDQVKRDTHSVYSNVALKTGLLGLIAFLAPFVVGALRALRSGAPIGRAIAAALVAVATLSLTVPFAWTVPGLSAALVLLVAALSLPTRSGAVEVRR